MLGDKFVMSISFYDWCVENNHQDILNMWDKTLNNVNPTDVSYKSDKKIVFSCGNNKHPVKKIRVASVTDPNRTGLTQERFCLGCHSVGKYLSDKYGEDYLESIWSDKNDKSPYEIAANSKKAVIWLRCLDDPSHPDYDVTNGNIVNTFGCPYCRNRRIYDGNNLAIQYPNVYDYWSDKNTLDPKSFSTSSHTEVWFKCPSEIHKDYKREIRNAIKHNFVCPVCLRIEASRKGIFHPFYKGNQSDNSRDRTNSNYRNWRTTVFERDGYTCQCCGKLGGTLNCHHIYSYSKHPSLRYNPNNGITLCEDCHSFTKEGSLHFLYGSYDVTPLQLEEYVNEKRKELGITDLFSVAEYIGDLSA